jgi:hypothetical protein
MLKGKRDIFPCNSKHEKKIKFFVFSFSVGNLAVNFEVILNFCMYKSRNVHTLPLLLLLLARKQYDLRQNVLDINMCFAVLSRTLVEICFVIVSIEGLTVQPRVVRCSLLLSKLHQNSNYSSVVPNFPRFTFKMKP